jgi:hypothetical protein
MLKKKIQKPLKASRFEVQDSITVEGYIIHKGDNIKIKGEYGSLFKFDGLVTNTDNGVQWIDCFELYKGAPNRFRSFNLDKVKRIPKKRKKVVN